MFYYLLYNSSFSFIVDNRLFTTVLYGSILYIITHAILNYCHLEVLEIINNYFWFIFILDIISLAYGVYQNIFNSSSNLDVSFNLLKNQISTISTYFNKKNDISITDNTLLPNTPGFSNATPSQPLRISTSSPGANSGANSGTNSGSGTASASSSSAASSYGENISIQQQYKNSQTSGFSTPITVLRDLESLPPSRNTNTTQIPELIITTNDNTFGTNECGDGTAESVAGSDVGSIMDLDDFEKSL